MSPEAPSFSLERPPGHLSGCRVPPDWQCFSTFPVGEAPGDQCVCSGAQATHTHLTESYLVPMGLKTCFGKQGKGLPESCLRAVPGKLPGGAKGQGAQLPAGRSLRQQCTPAFPPIAPAAPAAAAAPAARAPEARKLSQRYLLL